MSQEKRKKTSDRDIKQFFQDYHNAEARRKQLTAITLSHPLNAQQQNEFDTLGLFMDTVYSLVHCLEPLTAKIICDYYINHMSLFDISLSINYCYEHISYLKNIGCDVLRKIIKGEDYLQSEYTVNIIKLIQEVVRNDS